jgi:hypothetical protein
MTGWDTPSRPTWDPQDGPEDSTQAFPAPDNSGADDRWPQPAGSGWDGSGSTDALDFGRSDFGAPDFGGETAGGSDLGGADLGPGDYGRADYRAAGFPPEQNGFHQEPNGFPHEQNGFARGGASSTPPSEFLTQEFEQRKPGATLSGRGGYGSGPQVSARDEPPWPGPSRQESPRQESARPEYGRTGEYGRPDLGRADLDRQGGAGQDFPRRDPGRADYTAAYSTYSGQPEQAEQPPTADAELAARMDPALQDFFAPTKPDPRYGSARPGQAAQSPGLPDPDQPGPGQPGPGLPGPGRSGPAWSDSEQQPPRRGDGRGPERPGRPADPWQDQADYPSPGRRDGQRPPGPRADRRVEDEILPASRGKRILAIGAVVAIVAAGGAYLALHKTSGNNNAAGGLAPTSSTVASAPASTPAAKPKSKNSTKKSGVNGNATSSGGYVLSAPATAGGYPIGTDPHFLATATATVATIEQSAISGGGGTVTGSPVSASYTLPAEQTIEFVGYQGTFDPSKVMSNLGSFGTTEQTYSPGKNGGELACANTTATSTTPSGAVCVWVTKSTLGFTEFFTQANGPEALTTAMSKGAQDTINLRSSVETLKS